MEKKEAAKPPTGPEPALQPRLVFQASASVIKAATIKKENDK